MEGLDCLALDWLPDEVRFGDHINLSFLKVRKAVVLSLQSCLFVFTVYTSCLFVFTIYSLLLSMDHSCWHRPHRALKIFMQSPAGPALVCARRRLRAPVPCRLVQLHRGTGGGPPGGRPPPAVTQRPWVAWVLVALPSEPLPVLPVLPFQYCWHCLPRGRATGSASRRLRRCWRRGRGGGAPRCRARRRSFCAGSRPTGATATS